MKVSEFIRGASVWDVSYADVDLETLISLWAHAGEASAPDVYNAVLSRTRGAPDQMHLLPAIRRGDMALFKHILGKLVAVTAIDGEKPGHLLEDRPMLFAYETTPKRRFSSYQDDPIKVIFESGNFEFLGPLLDAGFDERWFNGYSARSRIAEAVKDVHVAKKLFAAGVATMEVVNSAIANDCVEGVMLTSSIPEQMFWNTGLEVDKISSAEVAKIVFDDLERRCLKPSSRRISNLVFAAEDHQVLVIALEAIRDRDLETVDIWETDTPPMHRLFVNLLQEDRADLLFLVASRFPNKMQMVKMTMPDRETGGFETVPLKEALERLIEDVKDKSPGEGWALIISEFKKAMNLLYYSKEQIGKLFAILASVVVDDVRAAIAAQAAEPGESAAAEPGA